MAGQKIQPLPVVYDPKLQAEAQYFAAGTGRVGSLVVESQVIFVGAKFYLLPPKGRREVLFHEIGHGLADMTMQDESVWSMVEAGAFGSPDARTGEIWGPQGCNRPDECVAASYQALLTDADWLRDQWPVAYRAVKRAARSHGYPESATVFDAAYLLLPRATRKEVTSWIDARHRFEFKPGTDDTRRAWITRWFPSPRYHSMMIPTELVGVSWGYQKREGWGSFAAASPVVVDYLKGQSWRRPSGYRGMTDLLALDGQHRLHEAYDRGDPEVYALVGKRAIEFLSN